MAKKFKSYEELNNDSVVIVDSMNRSDNGKHPVYRDYEAIITILMTIFNLPIGTLPYTPREGFDLRSLLWRSDSSGVFNEYELELGDKLRRATNQADVNVQMSKDYTRECLNINITYTDNSGNLVYMPFSIDEDENEQLQLRYKNVLVKP